MYVKPRVYCDHPTMNNKDSYDLLLLFPYGLMQMSWLKLKKKFA